MDAQEFARRFKEARLAAGYTQGEAARRLKIPRPRISEAEKGKFIPHVERVVEMITVLGLDPKIIFPEFFPARKR